MTSTTWQTAEPEGRFDLSKRRVWMAGHGGLVDSAVMRRLGDEPIEDLLTARSSEADLTRQDETERFNPRRAPTWPSWPRLGWVTSRPTSPRRASLLSDNLATAANALEACRQAEVAKVVIRFDLLCPREAPQPMTETALLTGPLAATNEGYAIAKTAALELGKMYRSQYAMDCILLMPTNLYGPINDFDLRSSHVLPALLRKIHRAKVDGAHAVEMWGIGTPRREFVHVDDLADAVVFATRHYTGEQYLNVGVGTDLPIRELVEVIADVVSWDGELVFNTDMPDDTPCKLVDTSRLEQLGWTASIGLREGIADSYRWYLDHIAELLGR